MSLVVESIIGIIGKHSQQRNEKEILPVIPWLKKRSKRDVKIFSVVVYKRN
jgi:hypothetical protein